MLGGCGECVRVQRGFIFPIRRPLQAHCHHGFGTLYAKTGQAEQARAALSAATDLCRAMDMTFWLPHAEAALATVGGA